MLTSALYLEQLITRWSRKYVCNVKRLNWLCLKSTFYSLMPTKRSNVLFECVCVCVTFLWTPETKALSFFFYFCKMAFVTLVKLMIFKETIAFRWPLIRKKQRQNSHNVPKRLFLYINLFCSSLKFAIFRVQPEF